MEKKDFGQHFLLDEEIIKEQVLLAEISKEDKVIEIGTGKGILTKEILKKTKNLISFEIDKDLEKEMKKEVKEKVVFGDATKFSWKGSNKIIANIPYYLSERIIRKAIKDEVELLVLIIGERLKNTLEKKESDLTYITNLFFEFLPVKKIEPESFSPEPRVNSWLVVLKGKKGEGIEGALRRIYMRNGKIKNAIISELVKAGKTKRESKEILKELGIPEEELLAKTKTIKKEAMERIKELFVKQKLE